MHRISTESHSPHVCPVWVGYLLASPLRKIIHSPQKILATHVRPGMRVLDIGCAMGFFSLPLAKQVGPAGRVICIDLQQKMLDVLLKKARQKHLDDRIEPRRCGPDSLGIADLAGRIDFALAFAVVHEVPDSPRLFSEIHAALKPQGRLLVAEPEGRVPASFFERSLSAAQSCGFYVAASPTIPRCRAAVLEKT